MNISLGKRWEEFVADLIATGRYGSSSEVVREGLRLVEEREAKLKALREMIERSIERGGDYSPDDMHAMIDGLADRSGAEAE